MFGNNLLPDISQFERVVTVYCVSLSRILTLVVH